MKVTEKDVAYVAELANLDLTDEERSRMLRDLNSILDYVDRLRELDTSDVPPMAHVSDRYGVEDGHIMLSVWAAAPLEPTRKGTFRRPSCPPVQQSPASRATVRQSGFLKPAITRSKS